MGHADTYVKLESLLRRYAWKKVLQNCSRISYGLDGRSKSPNHDMISRPAACQLQDLRTKNSKMAITFPINIFFV
jgi:hypothetical protein